MIELRTWGEKSKFEYEGSVELGTLIHYGNGNTVGISSEQYAELLKAFTGRIVNIGTSRTNPPSGSVGEWLLENITKVAISSYIGAILVYEGYAEKYGGPDIKFNTIKQPNEV